VRTLALLLALSQLSVNPLLDPARCVRSWLEAVRRATPYLEPGAAARPLPARESDYAGARRLIAPRALEEIETRAARGEIHPLAAWAAARTGTFVHSFELVAARRAPRGAAVITVRERLSRQRGRLETVISQYLVAPVGGEWRVVDRRPGGAFTDAEIEGGYAGWW
jgi:hypothetical protein